MGLNFDNTCPVINRGLEELDFSSEIRELIEYVIARPHLALEEFTYDIAGLNQSIYDSASSSFEDVRQTNVDMRAQAEKQIDELIEDRDEWKELSGEHKDPIDKLEDQLSDKNSELNDALLEVEKWKGEAQALGDRVDELEEENARLTRNLEDSI